MAIGNRFFLAFVGIAAGSSQSWSVIGYWIGVVAAWAWLFMLALKLLRTNRSEGMMKVLSVGRNLCCAAIKLRRRLLQ